MSGVVGVVSAASSEGQAALSASALCVFAAIVLVLTTVLVLALAALDHRSDPAQEAADTGLALLDAV